MPKNIPAEFTGRFSIKNKSTTKSKKSPRVEEQSTSAFEPGPSNQVGASDAQSFSAAPIQSYDYAINDATNLLSVGNAYPNRANETSVHGTSNSQVNAESHLADSYQLLGNLGARQSIARVSPGPALASSSGEDGSVVYDFLYLQTKYRGQTQQAATALCHNMSTEIGAVTTIWIIIQAIATSAIRGPASIDFILSTFSALCQSLPASLSTEYGQGSMAAMNRFHIWLREESIGFQTRRTVHGIALTDTSDSSNLKYQYEHVSGHLTNVLTEIERWKERRNRSIIMAAIHARAFALGMLRGADGRSIEQLIKAGLVRKPPQWSKVGFVIACILLRGCARTLLGRMESSEAELQAGILKQALQGYLLPDTTSWDDCFAIKAHATLALRNLLEGPRDEDSNTLFQFDQWIS